MKRLLVIVVLILMVVGLAIWFWPTKPTVLTPTNVSVKPHQSQSASPVASSSTPDQTAASKVQQPGGSYEPGDPRWKWWNEINKKDPQFEWKMAINFYGKVLDEKNQPVVGATITFTWTDLSPDGSSRAEILSDGSGSFALTGKQGKWLVVNDVVKDGYYLSKTENQFSYEYAAFFEDVYHQPEPDKPVIFRMKKEGVAEPLVYRDTLYRLKPDGTPHYLDLRTGRKSVAGAPSGDLILQLTRTPSSNPDRPNWTLTIEGVGNAGLIESSEEFMFEAPSEGYVNQIRMEQQGNDPNYQSQIYQNYFVRLADGKTFARIEAHLFSKYNDEAAINVTLYLNPSGSRNLEYDPERKVP